MPDKRPQTYANHAKIDPQFHMILLPLLTLAIIVTVWNAALHYDMLSAWVLLLLTAIAVIIAFRARLYSLKVQTRIIRLEERLRLAALLPEPLRARIGELDEQQLVGLRFASDRELPELVRRTLTDNLANLEIKKAVIEWRADYFRV